MFNKYEKKISEILEKDPVVLDYQNKKEKGSLSNNDKIQYVKYLATKTLEICDLVDKCLL